MRGTSAGFARSSRVSLRSTRATFFSMDDATTPNAAGSYRVLARKYRPSTFADLIGQDAMVRTDLERVRDRPHPAGLGAHRRARRRQDHDGAHPGARAQLRIARRLDQRADHRHADARRALPGDHGEPASRRHRDGRGFPQRRRGRARHQRGDPLRAGVGALQGLYPRRSAHAVGRRFQCAAQDAGRAAGARQVRVRHHRNPQSADHRAVALPALRSAPGRCGASGQASARHRREGNDHRRAGSFGPDRARRGRLGARRAVAA